MPCIGAFLAVDHYITVRGTKPPLHIRVLPDRLKAMAYYRQYNPLPIAGGAIVNVLLSLYLVPRYAAVGAAIATVASYTIGWTAILVFFSQTRSTIYDGWKSALSALLIVGGAGLRRCCPMGMPCECLRGSDVLLRKRVTAGQARPLPLVAAGRGTFAPAAVWPDVSARNAISLCTWCRATRGSFARSVSPKPGSNAFANPNLLGPTHRR